MDAAATSTDLVKLETDFTVLRNRVAGELTGARYYIINEGLNI